MAQPIPVEAPKPAPVYSGGCSIVTAYQWDARTAYAVCMAESGGNHLADNTGLNRDGSNDKGLMQINSIHTPQLISDSDRFDPEKNVAAAYAIYQGAAKRNGNGWTAWSSYNSGKYQRFL